MDKLDPGGHGTARLMHGKSANQTADLFTKALISPSQVSYDDLPTDTCTKRTVVVGANLLVM